MLIRFKFLTFNQTALRLHLIFLVLIKTYIKKQINIFGSKLHAYHHTIYYIWPEISHIMDVGYEPETVQKYMDTLYKCS